MRLLNGFRLLGLGAYLLTTAHSPAQSKPASKGKGDKTTCASCHQAQAFAQPESQMGRALQTPGANPVLDGHPKLAFQTGPYRYAVETHNGKSQYSISDGTQTITVPILWAMGANAQTWVLERDGQLYESRVSYYPLINGLGITTGDEKLDPKSLAEAIGRPMSNEEAKTCFNCHATDAVVDHKLNLASLKPGLTCEHCHADASAHLAAILADAEHVPIPKKLGQMSAEDTSNFCGQCHRTWETVVRSHWRGQADVRFQPYRLANSKCFNGTDPRIGCVACHNPHQKIVREASYYDAKCLACHATSAVAANPLPKMIAASMTTPSATNATHAKACPVANAKCTTCHMPKIPLPNKLMELTDHQIRIVKAGEPYPN